MHKYSLEFVNTRLEKEYSDFKWKFNKKPGLYLLVFNLYMTLLVSIYAIVLEMYPIIFYNIVLFGSVATIFYLSNRVTSNQGFQILFIICGTIVPYQVETFFIIAEMKVRNAGYSEWLLTGALSQIFVSFFAKFKIPWFVVISSKFLGVIYIIYLNLDERAVLNQNLVTLLIVMIIAIAGDYNQDRNDRNSFMKTSKMIKKTDFYRQLIEIIPDQVLIWRGEELVFGNRSAFFLFNQTDLKGLRESVYEKIEIIEYNDLADNPKAKNRNLFIDKILETLKAEVSDMDDYLNFPIISAYVRGNDKNREFLCEFDVKMKKIIWDNDDSVLVLMSKVEEKNVNARLEYVNSFLNYVLGNVSHEIATPFNILLGLIDVSIPQIQQKEVVKDLRIAKNMGEILINMFHTMIDLFNIRKGSLIMNLEAVNLNEEIKDIIGLFSEILTKRNVEVYFSGNLPSISTDRRRVRQILIGVLNFSLKLIEKVDLQIHLSKYKDLFEICFESHYKRGNNLLENSGAKSPLKEIYMKKTFSNSNLSRRNGTYSALSDSCAEGLVTSGMDISMLDYLVLCLSSGEADHLTIDHKQFSHLVCKFKLKDIRNSKAIQLKDLILEQKAFNVNYFKGGESLPSDSFDSTPNLEEDDTNANLMFSMFENPHRINEIKNYTQIFKLMPAINSNDLLKSPSKKKEEVNIELLTPFIKKSRKIAHSGISSTREMGRELGQTFNRFKKKYLILNVDDNFLNLMVISKYCRDFSFEVVEAKNGMEALKEVETLLNKERIAFDLIFMDCDMPILDGFEASRRINELYCEKKMFQPGIVAITANVVNEEIRMKIKKSGMKELVLKPMSMEKFKELLFKHLNLVIN